ncbi:MAG: DUF1080 domain-containing protein [Candidatus Hydrogenedentes bacterium]|nr:DUF1080 domain-containing protein [Candidatus Hydrogenedentota bacterium]
MKRVIRWSAVIICGIAVAVAAYRLLQPAKPLPFGIATPAPAGAEWIDLLDAEHQSQWRNITDDMEIFTFEGGTLHILGRTIYPLRYVAYEAERFSDFQVHIEFRVAKGANSGVFLRAQPNDPVYRGFEVQVLDDHGKAPSKNGSGSIYDVVTPMFNMARPAGEWNSYDITVNGGEVIVFMNGWRVVHANLAQMTMPIGKYKAPFSELPKDGLLMFQDHGGEVWYRNVLLKKL